MERCPKCNNPSIQITQGTQRCSNCGYQEIGVSVNQKNRAYISHPTQPVVKDLKETVYVANSEKLEGWMNRTELLWLASSAAKYDLIVEIGSYHGRSCRAMADNTKGKVIAIDTWIGPASLSDRKPLPSFENEFRKNLSDWIGVGKVIPLKPTAKELLSCKPDMVFIDGDHAYASVKADIIFWKDKVKKGGLICGHDYSCEDVQKAVNEFFPTIKQVPQTDIWFTYA